MAPKFTPPQIGQIIPCAHGNITITGKLNSGAFGDTYLANDEWGNELVAKIHKPKKSYAQVKSDWEREYKNLRELRHPNVTYIYDAFEWNYTFYIIMERCTGTLEDLINNPSINKPALLLPAARCILQGLSFMHRLKYAHKDIHAGNVFWTFHRDEFGVADNKAACFKIGDLGISNLVADIDVFGTVLAKWMLPPEYLDPRSFGVINTQVDIYHSALLLLALALGRIPNFSEPEILRGVPRETAEALGAPFGGPLSRALRRHVDQRTQTALAFWHDLRAAV